MTVKVWLEQPQQLSEGKMVHRDAVDESLVVPTFVHTNERRIIEVHERNAGDSPISHPLFLFGQFIAEQEVVSKGEVHGHGDDDDENEFFVRWVVVASLDEDV